MTSVQEQHLLLEHSFTASALDELSNTTLDLLIRNPADSGVRMLFYFGDVFRQGSIRLTMYDEVSGVSGGSQATLNNNVFGSEAAATEATGLENPTVTGENVHQEIVYAGQGVSSLFNGYRTLLPPGEDVLIRAAEQDSNNVWAGIRLCWLEL